MWQSPSEPSKRKTLVFPFLSFLAPLFPLHAAVFPFFLTVLRFSALTNTSVNEQTTSKEKGNLFLPTEGWRDFTLCLLSDTMFNLGEERRWFKTSETILKRLRRLWDAGGHLKTLSQVMLCMGQNSYILCQDKTWWRLKSGFQVDTKQKKYRCKWSFVWV